MRLRSARKQAKLTPSRLSLDAGLSDGVVRHIEDEGGVPGLATVQRLADALGISPAWLAYGQAPEKQQPPAGLSDSATFAERLQAARSTRGLSRKALARETGLSLTAITGLESGQVPSVTNAEKVAKALRVSPGWLAFGGPSATAAQTISSGLLLER